MPWIIWGAVAWRRSGMNRFAANEAAATPKLTAICWTVLAMVLAPLASRSFTSAYANEFMLVYCSDVRNPYVKAISTIIQTGVPASMVENRKIITPKKTVLAINTRRKPNLFKIAGIVSFRDMAAKAWGRMSNPAWIGEEPRPTWCSRGWRNGIP